MCTLCLTVLETSIDLFCGQTIQKIYRLLTWDSCHEWNCPGNGVYEFSFEEVHKNVCVWGCVYSCHGTSFYL